MIKKELASHVANIISTERFTVVKIANWLLFSVYLPCSGTRERLSLYTDILQEIQAVVNDHPGCEILIGDDFNSNLNHCDLFSDIINSFIFDNNLCRCDVLFPVSNSVTYVNESLNASNTIDYIVTSSHSLMIAFNVLDLDINFSDHLPLLVILSCDILNTHNKVKSKKSTEINYLRWDHAPLPLYYEQTRIFLQPVLDELILVESRYTRGDEAVVNSVDKVYSDTVGALQVSASMYIPRVRKKLL